MTNYQVPRTNTHSIPIGYLFWIFGFMGAHRFYYGKPKSGTLYLFTLGLLGVGWLVDAFFIPAMDREADLRFIEGPKDHTVAWALLTFLGPFGAHRFYLEKWISGILFLVTGGFLMMGVLYDFWTLNDQVSQTNRERAGVSC